MTKFEIVKRLEKLAGKKNGSETFNIAMHAATFIESQDNLINNLTARNAMLERQITLIACDMAKIDLGRDKS